MPRAGGRVGKGASQARPEHLTKFCDMMRRTHAWARDAGASLCPPYASSYRAGLSRVGAAGVLGMASFAMSRVRDSFMR
jgi:hypothetical protein